MQSHLVCNSFVILLYQPVLSRGTIKDHIVSYLVGLSAISVALELIITLPNSGSLIAQQQNSTNPDENNTASSNKTLSTVTLTPGRM